MTANANRAAATSAERENTKGISEVDQRANAQKDAIERNRAILEARAQARTTSRKPPTSTADVRNAAATSAESENIGRVSEAEQHVRAQRDAMERGMAALAAYEQARPASSNPPISLADVNRAAALLAARDEAHSAARDSLLSSPVITSERAPFSPTFGFSADTPMNNTATTSQQHYTVDQPRQRAARSVPELLRISPHDPEWLELTKQEKYDRQLAMNRERNMRNREKERAQRVRDDG